MSGICVAFVAGGAAHGQDGQATPVAQRPRPLAPTPWAHIDRRGIVTIVAPVDELGQGSMTALPIIFAEELDADWDDVRIVLSSPDESKYGNPAFGGMMYAVESVAVSGYFGLLRSCGAQTRRILMMNAAAHWAVPLAELSTRPSAVVHARSGRSLSYGRIAAFAQPPEALPPIDAADLKPRSAFRLIGKSLPRRDLPPKVTGKGVYSIDKRLPGMIYGTAVRAPAMNAELGHLDDRAARAVAGVVGVYPRGRSVVIAAESFPAALRARELLELQWRLPDGLASFSSDAALTEQRALALDPDARTRIWKQQGRAQDAFEAAATLLEAEYQSDYVYHAQMEPLNATVWVQNGGQRVEAWVGTQAPAVTVRAIAKAAGVPPANVQLHRCMVGGAFGRRAVNEMDFVDDAAWLSRQLERPVKVIWSREDDVAAGWFKPMTAQRLRAALDAEGRIVAWQHRVVSQEPLATAEPEMYRQGGSKPVLAMSGADELGYAFANQRVEHVAYEPGIRTYALLGVGVTPNRFAMECFMDQIAVHSGVDPLALRLQYLESPRARRVVTTVAEMADWGRPRTTGRATGLAFAEYHGTLLAGVVEISLRGHRIRVHDIWSAIDPGLVVQPDTVRAQVMGALVFGLGNALTERISFAGGVPEQSNFHDYRIAGIADTPEIHVELLAGGTTPTAVGQTAAVLAAPAIANAFRRLTGRRLTHMPFTNQSVEAALAE